MDNKAAATNLIDKLLDIPSPNAYPQQAGGAEFILFGIEYERHLHSLNAIPVDVVREAESEIHGQHIHIEVEFDAA